MNLEQETRNVEVVSTAGRTPLSFSADSASSAFQITTWNIQSYASLFVQIDSLIFFGQYWHVDVELDWSGHDQTVRFTECFLILARPTILSRALHLLHPDASLIKSLVIFNRLVVRIDHRAQKK